MDGWVTIGTKLDTKGLEQGIKKADSELKSYEKEAERLTTSKAKIEEDQTGLQKQINEYETLTNKADEYHQKIGEIESSMRDMKANSGSESGIFDPKYIQLEDSAENLKLKEQEVVAEIDKMSPKIDKAYTSYEKNKNKLEEIGSQIQENKLKQTELNSKIGEMNSKLAQSKGLDTIRGSIDNIGKGVSHTIGKVGRWAIGVFGVYSAYSAVRGAMNTLSQYNEQMATDIEYIRFALANTLKPVVEGIINLVIKLLKYINYIAKAWFGVNLFAGASAKDFKKAKDSAGGISDNVGNASKKAKELKRQLAGFDEMNILNDNTKEAGSSGKDAGGGGADIPSFDLGQDVEIPKWMEWIAKHKDEVIAGLLGIAGALAALKLGATLGQAVGIGIAIGGIVYAIEGLIKYLKDPSFENFGQIIQGIGVALIGLGIVIGIASGSWVVLLVGAIVFIYGTIVKYWNQIKEFLQKGIDWLTGQSDKIHEKFGDLIGNAYDTIVRGIQKALDFMTGFIEDVKKIFDGIIEIVKGIIKGDWSMVWDGAKKIVTGVFSAIIDTFSLMLNIIGTSLKVAIGAVKDIVVGIATWVYDKIIAPIGKFFSSLWNDIKSGAKKAWEGVKNIFSSVATWFKEKVIDKIVDKFKTLGTKVGNVVSSAFKAVVNGVLKVIESILNTPIKAVNGLIKVINKVPGIKLGTLPTFNLPRLAKGGIVNMPGKGVPIGGAIAGEHGAEGVIPLTDSQQMAMLGEAIGKYITVNFTNITRLDNRQIAREQKTISAQSNFAFNR